MISKKHLLRTLLTVGICLAVGIFASKVLGEMVFSTLAAGTILGALAILCLVGAGFGVWEARRMEQLRKRKQDIWLKH